MRTVEKAGKIHTNELAGGGEELRLKRQTTSKRRKTKVATVGDKIVSSALGLEGELAQEEKKESEGTKPTPESAIATRKGMKEKDTGKSERHLGGGEV